MLSETGRIEQTVISAAGEGAVLQTSDGLADLVGVEIESGMVLELLGGSLLTARESFVNRGLLRLGTEQTSLPLSITLSDIDECACGEILMEGGTSIFSWNHSGPKTFLSGTEIRMQASNNNLSASGDEPLMIPEGMSIHVTPTGFGNSLVTATDGIILNGQVTVGATEFPFSIEPGRNQVLEVREGEITAGEGAQSRRVSVCPSSARHAPRALGIAGGLVAIASADHPSLRNHTIDRVVMRL